MSCRGRPPRRAGRDPLPAVWVNSSGDSTAVARMLPGHANNPLVRFDSLPAAIPRPPQDRKRHGQFCQRAPQFPQPLPALRRERVFLCAWLQDGF